MKPRFEAVLFDCDGVLVDSERITNGVLREMLQEQGWTLSADDCMRTFIGKTLHHEKALIEAHTGKPVTESWLAEFRERRNVALVRDVRPIAHADETVRRLHAVYHGRVACASGADRFKVEMQLERCGLMTYFQGRVFSGHEMPRSKPAPDVYLAAAGALGVDPARCAVVEDTVTGVLAGVAAGATVFGYSPPEAGHDTPVALAKAGAAELFTDMHDLLDLLCQN